LFNLSDYGISENTQHIQNGLYTFVFLLIGLFFVCVINDERKKQLKYIWSKNKHVHGYRTFAVYFAVLILGSWFISLTYKVPTNYGIVQGFLSNEFYLVLFYGIVSFFETLCFAVLLPIITRHWAKNELVGDLFASVIFAGFHYYRYSGSFGALVFACVMNMVFIRLVWLRSFQNIPLVPLVVGGHQVYNLAKVGAWLYVVGV
jgi:hypothetical protein